MSNRTLNKLPRFLVLGGHLTKSYTHSLRAVLSKIFRKEGSYFDLQSSRLLITWLSLLGLYQGGFNMAKLNLLIGSREACFSFVSRTVHMEYLTGSMKLEIFYSISSRDITSSITQLQQIT